MNYEAFETLEVKEDGLKATIGKSSTGLFNAVFIDVDSNQFIQATVGIKTYEDALKKAKNYLNIK
jgi:hypothetical protein